jgi:hypothetical protein
MFPGLPKVELFARRVRDGSGDVGEPGGVKSRDKLSVLVEPVKTDDGLKLWAVIRFVRQCDREIVPSFEDLFQVVHAIVHCERVKYAGRVRKPSDMVRRFLSRMVDAS